MPHETTPVPASTVGAALRPLVESAGGQQFVASATGYSHTTIGRVLAGKIDPKLSTVERIAAACGARVVIVPDDGDQPGD